MTIVAKTRTVPFDLASLIPETEEQAAFLTSALIERDPLLVAASLGTIARARGMSHVAEEAGITRAALYKSLSGATDMRVSTFLGVLDALGLRLRVEAKPGDGTP